MHMEQSDYTLHMQFRAHVRTHTKCAQTDRRQLQAKRIQHAIRTIISSRQCVVGDLAFNIGARERAMGFGRIGGVQTHTNTLTRADGRFERH